MNILFEDEDIIVCTKPAGIATQTANIVNIDMVNIIKKHVFETKGISNAPVFLLHRLDQPVGGILVFAYNEQSAAVINKQINDKSMKKHYIAIVEGSAELNRSFELTSYLYKDSKQNKAIITVQSDKRGKEARLIYKCVKQININKKQVSILEIELITGRFHQIRAQLSSIGYPILNDEKYGAKKIDISDTAHSIALYANKLEFIHPKSNKKMQFDAGLIISEFLDKYIQRI